MSEKKRDSADQIIAPTRQPQSLRQRLLIFTGGTVLATLLIIGVSILYFIFQNEQNTWPERQGEVARRAAALVSLFIQRTKDTLIVVSLVERDNLVAEPRVMKALLAQNPDLLEMIRLDKEGVVFASAYQDAPLLANFFTLPQTIWFMESQQGRTYLSEVETSTDSQPYLIISVPAPDGGVVAARLRLTLLQELMTSLRFGETGQAYMVDRNGTIIAHSRWEVPLAYTSLVGRPEMVALMQVANQAWSGAYENFEGNKVVGATAPVMGTDWIVITEMTEAEAFKVSRTALFLFGGGLVLFGVLVMVVARHFLGRLILQPMAQLRAGAISIGQGNLSYRITLDRQDEIGQVAEAFNQMTAELQNLYYSLEQQVVNRTRQLGIAATLAERFNAILDLDQLLPEVVNQIKESFGYYHAHIYLLDPSGEKLVMVAGTGQASAIMKAKGHHIPLAAPRSLVALAARTSEVVNVDNVREVEDWLPNPLLPDTYSEMAIPIILDGQVVGVLDVQEDKVAGLDQGDASLLRTLANQMAVAMRNARLFQETRTALTEVEVLNRRLTRESWQEFHQETSAAGYRFIAGRKTKITADSDAWLPPMRQAAATKQLVTQVAPANGEKARAELAVPLMLRGEVIGVLGVKRDETANWAEEEKAAVEAVANQVAMALENARLAKEQEKTIVKLKDIDRLKSEFLTSMSHELRTPLNSIIGFADVLLQGIDGELNEMAMGDIRLIYNSGKHLLALINDILDLAKIEAGKMELVRESLDLKDIVDNVLASSNSLVKDKPVQIVVNMPAALPPVNADKLRLNQILLNLVSNAAKFTHTGTITIKAALSREPGFMRIGVADTGIGIPPEKLNSIFERFRQADSSTTRKYGGTGLGLAICKQLVEMHGGTIGVKSQEGAGSEFYFTIPLAEAPEA